ncbi:AraC family transcriptional regulator [Streptomyces sp. NPDC058228]|uniref:AraC family transcriptional regulator n=1 Tax=unclassified Streptomyces TaxID=2593676 RepID=UPI0036E73C9A
MELLVRTTSLNGYVDLVRSLRADPLPLVRSVGLDPAVLADPDQWFPVTAVVELLERSAEATDCPDFGLRLAEIGRLSNLGPLGLVAREEPDVRSALELLIQYLHLYNEALRAQITEANGLATVTVDLELETAPGRRRQAMELLVGVCHRIIRSLIAPDWSPVSVSLAHSAPADLTTHHRVLGTTIAYDQDFAGIVLYTADLDASNTLADPLLRTYARQFLQSLPAHRGSPLPQHVRGIVEALLPTGRCTIEQVARTLDVDVRTVQRHLARTGDTYSSLLEAVRADLAQRYVARLDRPLTDVAELLGFSALGTFSRWFHTRFGSSPTAWRAAMRNDPKRRG